MAIILLSLNDVLDCLVGGAAIWAIVTIAGIYAKFDKNEKID